MLFHVSYNFVRYFLFYIISPLICKEGKSHILTNVRDVYGRNLETLSTYFLIFTATCVLLKKYLFPKIYWLR